MSISVIVAINIVSSALFLLILVALKSAVQFIRAIEATFTSGTEARPLLRSGYASTAVALIVIGCTGFLFGAIFLATSLQMSAFSVEHTTLRLVYSISAIPAQEILASRGVEEELPRITEEFPKLPAYFSWLVTFIMASGLLLTSAGLRMAFLLTRVGK